MFGGTIKLQGATEYQEALNKITSNLKIMNSEMKVVTSSFSKNSATSKDLTAVNEQLNKKWESQKAAVANLEKVLERAKSQYGEGSAQVNRLTVELNNQKAATNKTERAINENNKTLEAMKKAGVDSVDALKEYTKNADAAADHSKTFADVFKSNILSGALEAGVRKIADALRQLGSTLKDQISAMAEHGDEIDKNSQKVGMSAEAYQEWNHVMELSGTSMDECKTGFKTMTSAMADAQNGSASAQAKFSALGISMNDLKGKTPEQAFALCIEKLQGMDDATQKAALASDLFGRSGQNLLPLLNQTTAATQDQIDAFKESGGVISNEAVKASAAYEDSLTNLKGALGGVMQVVGTDILPALTNFINQTVIPYIKDTLVPMIKENLPVIKQRIEAVAKALKSAGEFVIKHGNTILALAAGIGTALAAMKLGAFIMTVVDLAKKIKALSATTGILNAVMAANPLGAIALAIGAVVAVTVLLVTHWDQVKAAAGALWDKISAVFSSIHDTVCGVFDKIGAAASGFVEGIAGAFGRVRDTVTSILNGVLSFIGGLPSSFAQSGRALIAGLANGISGAVSFVTNGLGSLASSALRVLRNGFSGVASIGGDLIRGIWNGIADKTQWIINKIGGFTKSVLKAIKHFFGIKSPSRVMRDEVGKYLAEGIGVGFEEEMDDVNKRMAAAVKPDFKAVNIATTGAGSAAGGANSGLVAAFREAMAGMQVVLDDEKAGEFVVRTVTREVFA